MRIHHIAMRTADLSRLAGFYRGVLGLQVVPSPEPRPDSIWLAASGVVLMLERAAAEEPGVPHDTLELLAFTVEDEGVPAAPDWKALWRARIEAAGQRVEAETPHTLYFRDPDGRRLACSTHPLR